VICGNLIGKIKGVGRGQASDKVSGGDRLHVCNLGSLVLSLCAKVAADPLISLVEVAELVLISLFTKSAHN
jgi:hypothetical protein